MIPDPQSPGPRPEPGPVATVIVPTYNERDSLPRLVEELDDLGIALDLVVVDDASPDGTGEVAEAFARRSGPLRVRVLHRPAKSGLARAVIDGAKVSRTEAVAVMDADGSHPAGAVPRLIAGLSEADVVVASRYVPGSTITDWPPGRRAMSLAATALARRVLGIGARDPLSGFFAVRRAWLLDPALHAVGYKLLLEVLARHRGARVLEIPYGFIERRAGASKLSRTEIRYYLWLVWRLRGTRAGTGAPGPGRGNLETAGAGDRENGEARPPV